MRKLRLFKVLKVSVHLYCGSHFGGKENANQLTFPYNIIENYPISFVGNSVLVGPNDIRFGTETCYMPTGHIKILDKSIIIWIIMFW